jgi:two-component system, OmpR family, sensor kinase
VDIHDRSDADVRRQPAELSRRAGNSMRRLRFPRRRLRGGVPLRLRLSLLLATLLGLTLGIFSLFVYFAQAGTLVQEVDRALVDRAQVIARSVSVTGPPFDTNITVELPDTNALAFSGTLVQIVDMDGRVRSRTEILRQLDLALPVPDAALEAGRDGQIHFDLVELAGLPLRLYSQPLLIGRTPIGMIQVARWIGPTEDALGRLRLVLIGGALGSVALAIVFGLLLAQAALRPIDRLTREAEQIGQSQDFGRRVSASGSDEVGRLAATFNQMLDRLEDAFASLQTVNVRMQAALESQRRFVADASHELRTPLTTVRGNAALLNRLEQLTLEDREEVIAQIGSEADRMSRLVGDLLTLARADAGQPLERRPIALGPLLEGVAQQARLLSDGKVSVSCVLMAEAEALGDPDAIKQLLLILVDNAIKYTARGGGVTLGLRVEALHGQEKVARLTVVDTGMGIAPEDLPHIFERFYRADRARKTGGTGLGLAIGKWIAEAHGGRIEVESSVGAGSIFTVYLPVVARQQPLHDRDTGATSRAAAPRPLPEPVSSQSAGAEVLGPKPHSYQPLKIT